MKLNKKKIKIFSIILLIIVFSIFLYFLFMNNEKLIEGNRRVVTNKISNENLKKYANELKNENTVSDVSYNSVFSLITYVVEVNKDVTVEQAKEVGNKLISLIDEQQKEKYDIQIHINNNQNAINFPISGYKHKTASDLIWTKNN